ncbi:MAG TPA: NAD+ synthase [Acidimicrobiaceae bacterium]|nr:NAD+ synthase [Acidimicrobiaceae bacterium]
MSAVRIALCQLNPTVGSLAANAQAIIDSLHRAQREGADIAVFGELAICGYPPEDLVLKQGFLKDCWVEIERIAEQSSSCAAVVGFPEITPDGSRFNAAAICWDGRVQSIYRKQELPNYSVFDEARWFRPGARDQPLVEFKGVRFGVSICEDIWIDDGPVLRQAQAGAQILLNINGSPYHHNKLAQRELMLRERAVGAERPLVYVNQVGGQDELIFDGGSFAVGAEGELLARIGHFVEDFEIVDVEPAGASRPTDRIEAPLEPMEELWEALVLGTRDYALKNGFSEVVLGMSGGIDSSLVAAIAADALGGHNLHGVLMPSRFSSEGSVTDAERMLSILGAHSQTIAIEPAHLAFEQMFAPAFEGRSADLTEENLQSRIRGVTLMALSNKFGWLVLTTGNKSESAVGYSTLYGDTAGGLAVIKDVYKTLVYDLCRWRNDESGYEIIPESVLTKPPSAELRPDQRDDQSLPPYEVLDPILAGYVDGDLTVADLVDSGHEEHVVKRICRLVDLAEYKRRQNPPGLRVTSKAFGRDRRLPITNGYR